MLKISYEEIQINVNMLNMKYTAAKQLSYAINYFLFGGFDVIFNPKLKCDIIPLPK